MIQTMIQSAQTIISSNQHKVLLELGYRKIEWRAIFAQIYQEISKSDYSILAAEKAWARILFHNLCLKRELASMSQDNMVSYIYLTLPNKAVSRLCHFWTGDSHVKERFLSHCAKKKTRNHDIDY